MINVYSRTEFLGIEFFKDFQDLSFLTSQKTIPFNTSTMPLYNNGAGFDGELHWNAFLVGFVQTTCKISQLCTWQNCRLHLYSYWCNHTFLHFTFACWMGLIPDSQTPTSIKPLLLSLLASFSIRYIVLLWIHRERQLARYHELFQDFMYGDPTGYPHLSIPTNGSVQMWDFMSTSYIFITSPCQPQAPLPSRSNTSAP